jgi:hypothetical protein
MTRYKAVLFAPDGDWVTDFRGCETVDEVKDCLDDMGSRWYFYPYQAVIVDKGALTTGRQRLVDVGWPHEDQKGRSIATFGRMLAALTEDEHKAVLS